MVLHLPGSMSIMALITLGKSPLAYSLPLHAPCQYQFVYRLSNSLHVFVCAFVI